jgi:hypothetical protein
VWCCLIHHKDVWNNHSNINKSLKGGNLPTNY